MARRLNRMARRLNDSANLENDLCFVRGQWRPVPNEVSDVASVTVLVTTDAVSRELVLPHKL